MFHEQKNSHSSGYLKYLNIDWKIKLNFLWKIKCNLEYYYHSEYNIIQANKEYNLS